jgi:RAT1-interacting protein
MMSRNYPKQGNTSRKIQTAAPCVMQFNAIEDPIKLGTYSVTWKAGQEDIFEEKPTNLKILNLPNQLYGINVDLTDGYKPLSEFGSVMISQANHEDGINRNFLKWITRHPESYNNEADTMNDASEVNFVSSRSVFARVMLSPTEKYDGWCMAATKFKGTIYLTDFIASEKMRQWWGNVEKDDYKNRVSYAGLKFENYITHPQADGEAHGIRFDAEHSNDTYFVVKSKIGAHYLMYSGSVKAARDRDCLQDLQLSDVVDIKTAASRPEYFRWQHKLPFHKLLRWWTSNTLMGTREVYVGYRTDDLVVKEIAALKVDTLDVRGNAGECYRFLERFLELVKQIIVNDDPDVMYEFKWKPGQDVKDITCIKTVPTEERFVIPQWFIESV